MDREKLVWMDSESGTTSMSAVLQHDKQFKCFGEWLDREKLYGDWCCSIKRINT